MCGWTAKRGQAELESQRHNLSDGPGRAAFRARCHHGAESIIRRQRVNVVWKRSKSDMAAHLNGTPPSKYEARHYARLHHTKVWVRNYQTTLTAVPMSAHPYTQAAMPMGRFTQPWLIRAPKFECQYVPWIALPTLSKYMT